MTRWFFVCASLMVGAGVAGGTVLIYEPFNYSDGALVAVSGGVWTTHSGTSGQLDVIAGRLDLRVPQTEDVSTVLGQTFPAGTNTVLYASFTLNCSELPSSGGQYFAHFKGSGTSNFRAKVFALSNGAGAGKYRIGIANVANAPSSVFPLNLSTNADQRVYLRYTISNASATLWVNPYSEASPSVVATDSATAALLNSFALRQDNGIGAVTVDDLRVGTSFAEVYQTPITNPPVILQQPINAAVSEGGVAGFSVLADGTEPLSYQWSFCGTNLPGATNADLVLSDVSAVQAGPYEVTIRNAAASTNSAVAVLTVIGPSAAGTLTLVTYNVKGNFASDWSTNAPQVQAIARELRYLNPDIITLNEIPNGLRYEMTNWMTAFFPTFFLAVSSNTDGAIRSGFISRYPFTRTQSWLAGASLAQFGYAGTFTRDLFEAEILIPGATESLHAFTAHLKSGSDPDSQDRRAAECGAISNFFTAVFLPGCGDAAYVLTGDLNEDIALPMSRNHQPIQRLLSALTGLKLNTPINPFTAQSFTHSIQGTLDARFDYVLPAGVLGANLIASQVFRTDVLPPPLPSDLNRDDDIVASDHLPVVAVFSYPDPVLRVALNFSNQNPVLNWPALVGRKFRVEASSNLVGWAVLGSNVVATASQVSWSATQAGGANYFRVVRVP